MHKKTVYIALSLTHLKTDTEKQWVRDFLAWFRSAFDVELLLWAFDTESWQAKKIDGDNVYLFDSERVLSADLVIVIYSSNDGSDGRGGEVVQRTTAHKPIVAFAFEGVKVSRYPADCLKLAGVDIVRITRFEEMKPFVDEALQKLSARDEPPALE